jgi:hypothetical protein
MKTFGRRYGAHPLNLLAMLASFAVAGYAAQRLVSSHPIAVIVWFVGAAVIHDLVLLPLYAIADRGLHRRSARKADRADRPVPSWINYVRVPTAVSGLLLLVYFPSIARLSSGYHATTTLSSEGFLVRWLLITGGLFLLSAVAFAAHLGRRRLRNASNRDATNDVKEP